MRGHGVTADTVLPNPGSSIQLIPALLVLRLAWAASIEIPPSPSTKPVHSTFVTRDMEIKQALHTFEARRDSVVRGVEVDLRVLSWLAFRNRAEC